MRTMAVCVAVLAAGLGVAPAYAGWNGCGYSFGCGPAPAYLAPVPPYAVAVTTPTYVVRGTLTGEVVGQPMLVTVPAGPRPGYVVNQGQFPYSFDGVGAVPFGVPVAYRGWGRYGFGYGYGYRGYDRY